MDIVLALGGGGVRGYAHLGVVKVLQESGFRIRAISGSSAGAIVGSLVAAGHDLEHIKNKMDEMTYAPVFNRRPDDLPSFLGLMGFERFLEEMLGEKNFQDLEIPLVVNAIEIKTCKLSYLSEGKVLDSVMASVAVPGFFPPRQIDGKILFDGSILDPIPVRSARLLCPNVPVVAVALSPAIETFAENNKEASLIGSMPIMHRLLNHSRLAKSVHIFLQAVDIGSVQLADLALERDRPEIVIRPNVFNFGLLDRVISDDLVAAGGKAASEQVAQIRRAASWRGKLVRRVDRFVRR